MRNRRTALAGSTALLAGMMWASTAFADMATADRYIDEEFKRSTLTKEQQREEMQWFVDAAVSLAGTRIRVL